MTSEIKVVVVEDEILLAKSLSKNIERYNHHFTVAKTCHDGMSAMASIQETIPDVVFTDLKMPVMDGLALIRQLANKAPQIKTVIISGHNDFEYIREAFKCKTFDYLLKPVNQEALSDVLMRLQNEFSAEKREVSPLEGLSPSETVESIKTYLLHNYNQPLNLSEIADAYAFSQSYLSKIFKLYEGISPIKFLNNQRITAAKKLLAETNFPVKTIAENVGFSDQFHFSRQFKALEGSSPSTYRIQHK